MPIRTNGGVYNGTSLTGVLIHYKILGANFNAAVDENGNPQTGSAAEIIFTNISERATVTIMTPVTIFGDGIAFALEMNRSDWTAASLQEMIRSLGVIGIDVVDVSNIDVAQIQYGTGAGGTYVESVDGESGIVTLGAVYSTITDLDDHETGIDPHPQYLTPQELPSTLTSWYTGDTSTQDGAFLKTSVTQPDFPETFVSGSATVVDSDVLLGQWMRDIPFPEGATLFESQSNFQLDIKSTADNAEFYLEFWLRLAAGGDLLLATSDRQPLVNGRILYTGTVLIPGPFDVEIGDLSFSKMYINKPEIGQSPDVTLYMEGNAVTRIITIIPIATIPISHAQTHASGGTDELDVIRWVGSYENKDYLKNDMVLDLPWTMIANKDTSDRAAPQPNGIPLYTVSDVPSFSTLSNSSVVTTGHEYTFTESGWIERIRVWVPAVSATIKYRIIIENITDPANPVRTVLSTPVLVAGSWVEAAFGNHIVLAGDVVRASLESTNEGTETNISGGWTYKGSNKDYVPLAGEWARDGHNKIFINKVDLDVIDHSSEMENVILSSILSFVQTNDVSKGWSYEVTGAIIDNGTYMTYEVNRIVNIGNIDTDATCTTDIDIPVPASTSYVQENTYWSGNMPAFAGVVGIKQFNGVSEPSVADSAFGVDMRLQKAALSDDWDVLSHTSFG